MFESSRRWLIGSVIATTLMIAPVTAWAQGSTDIFLVRLHESAGRVVVDTVIRMTNRDGYDNQPSFVPSGDAVLFTSIDSTGQADIHRFDLRQRRVSRLTTTRPESEYSAAVMPDGERVAVIRVEADSTQRLWSFRMDGSDPRLVLERVAPAGYFAFIDARRIAVFVLGSPATLQVTDAPDGSGRVIASAIGRTVARVPGREAVSFVDRESGAPGWITIWDAMTGMMTRVIEPFRENEYHAWMPSGTIVTGRGSTLYRHDPATGGGWVEFADLSRWGVAGISRLAVSPDGRTIAVVGTH
jgi:dipeptidyl aminopeptidase/acylaminoacyl peptidase